MCSALCSEGSSAEGRNHYLFALEGAYGWTVHLLYVYLEAALNRLVGVVLYLALHADGGGMSLYVILFGIYINTCSLQVAIQWQCLVNIVCDVQPNILWQSAVVWVKVVIVPLEHWVWRFLTIFPVIIGANLDKVYVFLSSASLDIWCDIKAEGHNTIFVHANLFAVDNDLRCLACALKLYKHFFALCAFWQHEVLAIPDYGIAHRVDVDFVCLIFIPSTWKGNSFFRFSDSPVGIEVVGVAGGSISGQ